MIRFPFMSKDDTSDPIIEEHIHDRQQFEQVLSSFKATRIDQRLTVLDAFLSSEQHLTLTDLSQLVREHNPQLDDRAFLEETMEMFCQFGFAVKRSFESRETVYEHHHLATHHDHFICTRCGSIQEFANQRLEKLQMEIAADFGFHPLQHKMEIYGLCSRCMMQRSSTLPLVMAAKGEHVKIVALHGGRNIQNRLTSMGLSIGVCLEILNNAPSGPFIVAINDTRLALGTGIAQHVEVSHDCLHSHE